MGIFDTIEKDFKAVGGAIFGEVHNTLDTARKTIASVPNAVEGTVNKVIDTGHSIVNKVVDEGSSIVKGAEFTIGLPLLAVGIGIAIILARSSSDTVKTVGVAGIQAGSKVAI